MVEKKEDKDGAGHKNWSPGRFGDPEAWGCLNDEQREIIRKWYHGVWELQTEEKKRQAEKENFLWLCGVCFVGIAAGIVEFTIRTHGETPVWTSALRAIAEAVGGILLCMVVAFIGRSAGEGIFERSNSDRGRVISAIGWGLLWAVIVWAMVNHVLP